MQHLKVLIGYVWELIAEGSVKIYNMKVNTMNVLKTKYSLIF